MDPDGAALTALLRGPGVLDARYPYPDVLLFLLGIALIALAAVDAIRTTLSLRDAGPLTGRIAGRMWLAARTVHGRFPSHALLTSSGTVIVLTTLGTWILLMWGGWTLIFASDHGAIVDLQTRQPVDFVGRIYFAGYAITTLGTGDVVPVGGWRIATILCAASGLVIITLAITYFGPILEAVVSGRRLATFIATMGRTPQGVLIDAWHEGDLKGLDSYLANLAEMLNHHTHRHHAYPVIHFFHTGDPAAAVPLRLAVLDEAVSLMRTAVAPEARPHPMTIDVLHSTISSYLQTLQAVYIDRSPEAPAVPDLQPLRDAGIQLLPESEIEEGFRNLEGRRRLLKGLVEHDGWTWADVPLGQEGIVDPE